MPKPNPSENINLLWSRLIIEELRRCGVEYFCVAPGSRSAPLAVAVSQNHRVKTVVHFDERGLAFHALGLTSGNGRPAALITTSGTAVANLFPAIIEASKKKIPMIILTADRPPELRATGANQTIDQVRIFGDYVRFAFDMPCPTTDIPPQAVLTTIDQLVSRAKGELPGPVHLNCMFREPLTPNEGQKDYRQYLLDISRWEKTNTPWTSYERFQPKLASGTLNTIAKILNASSEGIIAVGKLSGREEARAVLTLARKLGWPIFPEVSSGLRLGERDPLIIPYFDKILSDQKILDRLRPQTFLQLGGRLTSKHWTGLIKHNPNAQYIMVLNHPLRNDPTHQVSHRVQARVHDFCLSILDSLESRAVNGTAKRLQKYSADWHTKLENTLDPKHKTLNEPLIARTISKMIPENFVLFIGNSRPIRDLNTFASPQGAWVRTAANRGASGIDGNIATALGFAKAAQQPCVALIGDLAFLHDLNSLSLLKGTDQPLILVVINNNGGGIFSALPIARVADKSAFKKFFLTPHGLSFQSAAQFFGIDYEAPKSSRSFHALLQKAFKKQTSVIIEIKTS